MLHSIRHIAAAFAILIGLAVPAMASDAVLSLTHNGQTVSYDMEALQALGAEQIKTTTIWTEGVQTFKGVPLYRLLQEQGIEEGTLLATAINDYTVEIPTSDAVENGPILAMQLNGNEMSVRDKGPLWVIYPYDANTDYQTEVIYSRSIWQLDRITVVE